MAIHIHIHKKKVKDSTNIEIRPQLEQLKRFVTGASNNSRQAGVAIKLAYKIKRDIESLQPANQLEKTQISYWKDIVQQQIDYLEKLK